VTPARDTTVLVCAVQKKGAPGCTWARGSTWSQHSRAASLWGMVTLQHPGRKKGGEMEEGRGSEWTEKVRETQLVLSPEMP